MLGLLPAVVIDVRPHEAVTSLLAAPSLILPTTTEGTTVIQIPTTASRRVTRRHGIAVRTAAVVRATAPMTSPSDVPLL